MKLIAKRTICALVVAVFLLAGLAFFCFRYALYGGEWVTSSGSPHVYTSGNLDTGTIQTSDGVTVLMQNNGERTYAEDPILKKATLHLLGDRSGFISATILSEYADELVGYNPVSGLYGTEDSSRTLTLTVSAAAQKAAWEALNGRKGAVAVYNYQTGEVLCAVTSPSYDPDNVPDIANDTTGEYDGVYLNRLSQCLYVPGSIFKLVTLAAALETVDGIEDQTFTCNGSVDIGGDTIHCAGNHGTITIKEALAKSCNCAFAQIAGEVGAETLSAYAEKLGITTSYDFDGISTVAGQFDLSEAAESEISWAGIGQYTDLMNPYSFLVFMGMIGGDGNAALPALVQSVTEENGNAVYTASVQKTGQKLQSETCEILSELMRNDVETVYGAGQFGTLNVCAKSGTAEVSEDALPHATFAGFVNQEDCPLAFIVVVENAGSGSETCAPIAAKVLLACAETLQNVP